MVEILPFELPGSRVGRGKQNDRGWAVVAVIRTKRSIAGWYSTREAAQSDCAWRREQVRAYSQFLQSSDVPVPDYHIAPLARSELPKNWKPAPALGLLHGKFSKK
ncbi:hypothetical protein LOC54_03475 [Acetobacter sp. AN02]|uniref:hypothetical protein n=1 Tax=Acetobacter sp. AN02 TaxID=2894186 RepID=UPI002434221F|nr:hypothetical protein [Acetobacter sp. AN02]MDG6094184.1 hypothetical protein [Acetobacter sp. AN02]